MIFTITKNGVSQSGSGFTLQAGVQHSITFNTFSTHPVEFVKAGQPCHGTIISDSGVPQSATNSATFMWTPSAAGTVNYWCNVHCFGGTITLDAAPAESSSTAGEGEPSPSSSALPVPSSSAEQACGSTFAVSQPLDTNLFYTVAGMSGPSPTLQLSVGCVYTFTVNAPDHPMILATASSGSPTPPLVVAGVTPTQTTAGITTGTLTFTPTTEGTFFYYCVVHQFSGEIIVTTGTMNSAFVQTSSFFIFSIIALLLSL